MNMMNISFQPISWWILAIFILVATGVMIFYLNYSKGYKKVPLFLRALLFLFILILIFQPIRSIKERLTDKPILALLVDTSGSMGIKDPVSRSDLVKRLVLEDSKFIQNLTKTYNIYPFLFSTSVEYTSIKDIPQIKLAQGQATDIGLALKQVSSDLEGKHLAGILLISDGIHNGQWDPVFVAGDLGVPVSCIGVGNRQKFQDLSIGDIKVSDFAFTNTPVNVEIGIIGKGYGGQEISLILKESTRIIKTLKLKITDEELTQTNIEFTPQQAGSFTYTVSIPPYKGEFSSENNSRNFNLDVLKEKTRILYICGEPSWEYRFLREVLKSDPNIELVSFIILRNPENIAIVPEIDLSLIPFPTQEIFLKEIFDFDMLIFENFSYTRFFPKYYLENIKKFVTEEGKAFIMLGGESSFGMGEYKNTAIEDILPVEIEGYQERMIPGKFRLQITDYSHPVVRLGEDIKESQNIWSQMPELDGSNRILKAKKEAVVLGIHPWMRTPVLALWQKGKGRVMAMASNTTWRWSMGLSGEGKTNFLYSRFWQKAIRWLIKAPEVKLVRLTTDKKEYIKGEKIRIKITAFDEYYRPLQNARLDLDVVDPLGKKIDIKDKITETQQGIYEAEFEPQILGKHKFNVILYDKGRILAEDTNFCELIIPISEFARLHLDEDLLKKIASLTGGKYLHIEEIQKDMHVLPEVSSFETITVLKQISLWDSFYLYIILIFLLTAEWYIRRKSGML